MERAVGGRRLISPRDDVALMAGYYSPQFDVDVRLNTNEAPEAPPAPFVASLADAVVRVPMNRYPDREASELRAAIAQLHHVDADRVYCANGSNEVLQSLLLAYGGPGRTALVFEPTYALHSHIAHVTGTAVAEARRDDDYLVATAEFDRAANAASPAVTFICSPNNPTGRLERFDTVEAILERSEGLVVVDEAYGQFAPRSAVELTAEHRNLVVVRTFSKTWSLAALRLGYAIGDPEVVEALWHVTLPYHLDAFKQAAGVLALGYEEEMRARVARIVGERERLLAALASLDVDVVPSDANFVLFGVRGRDATTVWRDLVAHSVLVRDVSGMPYLAGHLRVTVGTPEENDAFLAALRRALASDGGALARD